MRVLYLCADPGIPLWGTKGASIHVRAFASALEAEGHEVSLVVARQGKGARSLPESIQVIEIPGEDNGFFTPPPGASLEQSTVLYEARQFSQNSAAQDVINDVLAHAQFDVICERYSLFSIAGRESARWHEVPFVLEVNAPLIRETKEHRTLVLEELAVEIERYLYATADHVVPVSAPLAGHIRSIAPDARVTVIPNGVDVAAFSQGLDAGRWRRTWGLNGANGFCVGFIGSLKPWHGLEVLLDAFQMLDHDLGDYRLVLIGDGPLRGALDEMIRIRKLENRVIMTGAAPHDEIPSLAAACDVLVAPYPAMDDFYFSPLKVYEYMAVGKPIVASRIGQLGDLLADEVNALLTDPGQTAQLAAAIMRLRRDHELAQRLANRARADARDLHAWCHRVRDWVKLIVSSETPRPLVEARP